MKKKEVKEEQKKGWGERQGSSNLCARTSMPMPMPMPTPDMRR
jgi:hypothetical protein